MLKPNPEKPGSSWCPDEHITWPGIVTNILTTAVHEYKSNLPPPSITSSRNTAARFIPSSTGLCTTRGIWMKASLSHIMSYISTSDGADTKLLLRSLCTVLKNGLLPLIMSDARRLKTRLSSLWNAIHHHLSAKTNCPWQIMFHKVAWAGWFSSHGGICQVFLTPGQFLLLAHRSLHKRWWLLFFIFFFLVVGGGMSAWNSHGDIPNHTCDIREPRRKTFLLTPGAASTVTCAWAAAAVAEPLARWCGRCDWKALFRSRHLHRAAWH